MKELAPEALPDRVNPAGGLRLPQFDQTPAHLSAERPERDLLPLLLVRHPHPLRVGPHRFRPLRQNLRGCRNLYAQRLRQLFLKGLIPFVSGG